MKNRYLPIILCAAAMLFSCETPLPLSPEQTDPLLVLNCSITNDVPISVSVSRSRFFLGASSTNYITDATVKIYINDILAETLTEGVYNEEKTRHRYNGISVAHAGDKVRIEASSSQFPEGAWGETTIPQPQKLTNITLTKRAVNSYGVKNADLTIGFSDDDNSKNYYKVMVCAKEALQNPEYADIIRYNYRVRYTDPVFMTDAEGVGAIIGTNDPMWDEYWEYGFFSDTRINGVVNYPLTVNLSDENNYNLTFEKENIELSILFTVFDEHYCRYFEILKGSRRELNEAFYDPIQYYSNIIGGTGLVGSCTETSIE